MSRDAVKFWDGKTIDRYRMHIAVDPQTTFYGIFTRKKEEWYEFQRFYIYSEDASQLIIAGEYHPKIMESYTVVSFDSTNFDDTVLSKTYLGFLASKGKELSGISWHVQAEDCVREMIHIYNSTPKSSKNPFYQILIPQLKKQHLVMNDVHIAKGDSPKFPANYRPPEDAISLNMTKVSPTRYECMQDSTLVFSLEKVDDDEFKIMIKYPLSSFQGICLAIVSALIE